MARTTHVSHETPAVTHSTIAREKARNTPPEGYPLTIPGELGRQIDSFMQSIIADREKALTKCNTDKVISQIMAKCQADVETAMMSKFHPEAIIVTLKDGSVFWATTTSNKKEGHIPVDAIAYLASFTIPDSGTRKYGRQYMSKLLQLAPFMDLEELSYMKKGKLQALAHHRFIKFSNQKSLKRLMTSRFFGWKKDKRDHHRLSKGEHTYYMEYNMRMHEKFPRQERQIAGSISEAKHHLQALTHHADVISAQQFRAAQRDISHQLTGFDGTKAELNEKQQSLLKQTRNKLKQQHDAFLKPARNALKTARQFSFTIGKMHSLDDAKQLVKQVRNSTDFIANFSREIAEEHGYIAIVNEPVKARQQKQEQQQQQKHDQAEFNKVRHNAVLEIESLLKSVDATLANLYVSSNPHADVIAQLHKIHEQAEQASSNHEVDVAVKSAKETYLDALDWAQNLTTAAA